MTKLNIHIIEILEGVETDLLGTNDLTLESFELFDILKYKFDKEYAEAIDKVIANQYNLNPSAEITDGLPTQI